MSKLADIKRRMAAASPGPWIAEKDEVFRPGVFGPKGTGYFGEGNIVNAAKYDNNQADIEFVAHSREDMALLLAVVEAALLEDASPAQEAKLARCSADILADRVPGSVRRLIEKAQAWEGIA